MPLLKLSAFVLSCFMAKTNRLLEETPASESQPVENGTHNSIVKKRTTMFAKRKTHTFHNSDVIMIAVH